MAEGWVGVKHLAVPTAGAALPRPCPSVSSSSGLSEDPSGPSGAQRNPGDGLTLTMSRDRAKSHRNDMCRVTVLPLQGRPGGVRSPSVLAGLVLAV